MGKMHYKVETDSKIYIPESLDRIFGGNFIDLQVNGFVNLDFGGRFQKS